MSVAADETIFVCARTYASALDYAKKQGYSPRQLRYIDTDQKLMGLRGVTVHLVGAWSHLPFSHDIVRQLNARELDTKVVE